MTIDHANALDAERGMLGSCMLSQDAVTLCSELNVSPLWFTRPDHRAIWSAILGVFEAGGRVDSVSVGSRLRASQALSSVGGIQALRDMESACVSVAFSEYHVAILKDAFGRREIAREMHDIQTALANGAMSSEMIAANAAARLDSMFSGSADDVIPFESAVEKGVREWTDVAEGRAIAVPTGIDWMDRATGGIPANSVTIIQGPAGSGKTTLARMICENVAKAGRRVSLRSLEQTSTQIAQGVLAAEAGIAVSKLNLVPVGAEEKGRRQEDLYRISAAQQRLAGIPFEVNDRVTSVSEFRAWATRKANRGAKLIVVDYLQRILRDRGPRSSDEEHVSQCSTIVYEVAKRTGVPVVAVCSENRAGTVRSSGQAEYDAWIILKIRKSTEEKGDFGEFDPFENPCYIVDWVKARFAPAGHKFPVYWHYGKLLTKEEWEIERMKWPKNK